MVNNYSIKSLFKTLMNSDSYVYNLQNIPHTKAFPYYRLSGPIICSLEHDRRNFATSFPGSISSWNEVSNFVVKYALNVQQVVFVTAHFHKSVWLSYNRCAHFWFLFVRSILHLQERRLSWRILRGVYILRRWKPQKSKRERRCTSWRRIQQRYKHILLLSNRWGQIEAHHPPCDESFLPDGLQHVWMSARQGSSRYRGVHTTWQSKHQQ